MREPAPPIDETARLMSLHSLRILDTPTEERYDRLTRMAKRLFGVQIALVSLVDTNRQWFKSKQGLDACETSRAISFCGHAILKQEVFVVEDAICSRSEQHRDNAIQRMQLGGVKISNTESVAFEWVADASHPHFSEISQLFR